MTNTATTYDAADRRLLTLLQRDNRQSLERLAAQANLSPSAVRRRVKRLRDEGVIAADVSILAADTGGIEVIVHVMMQQESSASYGAFRNRVRAAPEVTQCYSVTGDSDFVLHVRTPDLVAYEQWIEDFILADPDVRRCDSHVVYSRVKFTTEVPLG